jgi:hypothetical protein
MSLVTALLTLDVLSTDTPGTTKSVAHGLGLTPKAAIVFWSGQGSTSDNIATTVPNSNIRPGVGVMVSASERGSASMSSADAAGTANSAEMIANDAVCAIVDNAGSGFHGALDAGATAFDGTNVNFVVDAQFTDNIRLFILVIGGTDLTDLSLDIVTEPGATGNQDITSVEFQPDCVLFLGTSCLGVTSLAGTFVANTSGNFFWIGAAAGATPVSAIAGCGSDDGPTTMLTRSYTRTGECVALVAAALASITARASLTAWLSNGFRLNWSECTAGARQFLALSLKGGRYAIGELATSTGTTQQTETGVGFQPKGLLLLSSGAAASSADTLTTHNALSIGAAGGTGSPPTQKCVSVWDENGVGTSTTANAIENDAAYVNISTSEAIEGRFAVDAFNSDGFTWTHDDADPSSVFAWYLAMGDAPSGGGFEPAWARGANVLIKRAA